MADIIIDIASEFTGAKAFKKAESATEKLSINVKSLAKSFGLAFGTAQVIAYGKASVRAAAADQKAQKQLALALKNVGLSRDVASSEAYIQRLQSEFGILDDDLRPAYQTLAIATRDSNEAQRLLNLALDVSASTTKPLASVTTALSKAYLGNNTALSKLGIGISKADLKSKSFYDITEQLSTTFAGAAKSAANTYQGSLDKLTVAANNAKEVIGTGLIEAISAVGSTNGVDGLTANMQKLSFYVSDTVEGIGIMVAYLKGIPGLGKVFDFLLTPSLPTELGTKARLKRNEKFPQGAPAELVALSKYSKIQDKIVKDTTLITKLSAQQLKDLKLKTAIEKANLALNKGTNVFDIEAIQNNAALINQAELLAKTTNGSQLLQIANDTARLNVKKSIYELEQAIASGDAKAIETATAKLNEDLKILGVLSGQKIQLSLIKSILDSLNPKQLIDLDNLQRALELLSQINLASTGSRTTPSGLATPTAIAAATPSTAGLVPATTIAGTNANVASLGGVITQIQPNLQEYTPNTGMLSGMLPNGREFNFTVNVNTGVGDPNAIAEAINQYIIDAVDRGTMRGGAY